MKCIHGCAISALIYVAVMPASSFAQTAEDDGSGSAASEEANAETQGIQDIIVTAERRTAVVQSTAASVSVRTGEELASQGRFSLRQVLEDVVGVTGVENNSINPGSADVQGNNVSIRGITPGSTAGAAMQISATPATAVYVDGVYEGLGSVYDVDRVEVLRGPGGTLYGRSATAGVIAFHTRDPMLNELEVSASAELGNYELQHYTAALNVPLGSTLAVRVSGNYRDQGEGYFHEGDRGLRERINGRVKLLWQPTDALSVLLGAAYEEDNANSGGNQTVSTRSGVLTTFTNAYFPAQKEQEQYWAEVDWDAGPVAVTYLGALRTWQQNDFYLQTANFIGSGVRLEQLLNTPVNRFLTQELRFASTDDESDFYWQAGAFYYRNKLETSNRNFLADNNNQEIALQLLTEDDKLTENLGVFAEATFSATPEVRVTLGARYDDTNITVSEFSFENPFSLCGTALQFLPMMQLGQIGQRCTGPGQASIPAPPGASINDLAIGFHNFNYKARVEYDIAEWNLLYASVSTGFRPGDAGISRNQLNVLDTEKLTSFEIGSKNMFLDNRLQLNVGAYYYIYRGFQTQYQEETPSPADYANFSTIRVTVPARNFGFEVESMFRPTNNDLFSLNYSYLQSRWHNKPAGFAAAQIETRRALTPHTIQASYAHIFQLSDDSRISARIDGKFESAHLDDDLHVDLLRINYDDFVRVGDRLIGNAQLTWTSGDGAVSISAYVRNFTNEDYVTRRFSADLDAMYVEQVDPRTFGIIASMNF